MSGGCVVGVSWTFNRGVAADWLLLYTGLRSWEIKSGCNSFERDVRASVGATGVKWEKAMSVLWRSENINRAVSTLRCFRCSGRR